MPIRHGPWDILGFRFGRFAYLTDCNGIPDDVAGAAARVSTCLVLDALRHRPHPTHFTLDAGRRRWRGGSARAQTFFTHIAHDLGHAATCASLPAGHGAGATTACRSSVA